MPVAAEVRRVQRYEHDMAGSRPDLLVAPGAHVLLAGLEGLDAAHLGRPPREGVVHEARRRLAAPLVGLVPNRPLRRGGAGSPCGRASPTPGRYHRA